MAHGLNSVLKRGVASVNCKNEGKGIGSRRIFAPHFKLQVLDSYRNDADCKGNQRATARKYGIHRRQIQKWLQVENTLRSSVSAKEKSGECVPEVRKCEFEAAALNANRQRDDEPYQQSASMAGTAEARVPALTHGPSAVQWPAAAPLPLDFTTHSRGQTASPACPSPPAFYDPAAPMDLSFKRPTSIASGSPSGAPVCYAPLLSPPRAAASPSLAQPHPDVWDLSVKNLKRKCRSPDDTQTSPKPVKLFKPYLDINESSGQEDCPPSIVKLEPAAPCCSIANCEAYYYNNNNNICDIKSEYGSYTLHELQPKSPVGYYYNYPPSYPAGTDYDIGGYCGAYEDVGYGGHNLAPLKQRQSYSLDFKLSAIDCYYQDSVCKGNQRAVATKYNIHRRQVQKWLKQAEELRMRNESMKQMHAVR